MSGPNFTCNSCEIQFKSSDSQRYHMKTEWHRYNLKRRVANLPRISAAEFAEKLQLSEQQRLENEVDEFGFAVLKPKGNVRHQPKEKKISRKPQAIDSRGRSENVSKLATDDANKKSARSQSPAESVTSEISKLSVFSEETNTDYGEDTVSEYGFTSESNYNSDSSASSLEHNEEDGEVNTLSIRDCIYCDAKFKETERNVNHMFREHGLYIPERSYLTDLAGLLKYLIEVIVVEKNCFCCSFEGSSLESIRAHMNSKRHCRLPYETKEERERLSPYYDFSLAEDDGQPSPSGKRTQSSVSLEGEEGQEAIGNDVQHDVNSNFTTVSVDDTGMEMTLPTGARLGHRIGQRYYRQNLPLPPDRNDSRRTVTAADRRIISGVTEKQYKQGVKKMQQLERNDMNRHIRQEKSKKVNFQPHYRDELLQ